MQFIEIGDILGATQCSRSLGNVLGMQSRYDEATAVPKEVRAQFIEIGDISDPPECSKTQGNILYMQSRYDEATDVLRRARAMFIEIGSVLGAGAFRA